MQIHVDTGNSPSGISKNSGNPFDICVSLTKVHRNITSIALKNVQLPIGFYTMRSPYNTFTIGVTVYTLTPGNYTITSLITALNSLITGGVGAFSLNTVTNIVTYTSAAGSVTISGNLLTILGFVTSTGSTIIATNSYLVSFDTHIFLYFPDFGTSSSETTLGTFKVPINANSSGIVHWAELSQNVQKFKSSVVRYIDKIRVKVIDRYGNALNNNGVDWSFTLEIESDS